MIQPGFNLLPTEGFYEEERYAQSGNPNNILLNNVRRLYGKANG